MGTDILLTFDKIFRLLLLSQKQLRFFISLPINTSFFHFFASSLLISTLSFFEEIKQFSSNVKGNGKVETAEIEQAKHDHRCPERLHCSLINRVGGNTFTSLLVQSTAITQPLLHTRYNTTCRKRDSSR